MHRTASRTLTAEFACGVSLAVVTLLTLLAPPMDVSVLLAAQRQPSFDPVSGVSVSDARALRMAPGEVQSTVVPPGKIANCAGGRLLISNDHMKEPAQIASIDLANLDSAPILASFDFPASWGTDRRILSNDHDIVTLPNGHVLLVKMGQSKMEIEPMPIWFNHTYKLTYYYKNGPLKEAWGPGARSEILVWRSEDCGSTFQYVSAIDTARINDDYGSQKDGSAALPQTPMLTTAPGTMEQPVWQMGGTDGILTRVDPVTGRVYVTVGLVGHVPASDSPFMLNTDVELQRTVVMMSSDDGASWERTALVHKRAWRFDVVPRANDMLAFGHSLGKSDVTNEGAAFVIPACPLGCVVSDSGGDAFQAPITPGNWGWDTSPEDHPVLYMQIKGRGDYMGINIFDRGILTRSPSSQDLLFAYNDTIDGKGDGYRLFSFDGTSGWQPFSPITPEKPAPNNFTLHVTPVDPGSGPVFFYWYDVDTDTNLVTMRGKIVTNDSEETIPFPVSRRRGAKSSFDASADVRWYGDYHTAGGYVTESGTHKISHYYPVWLESDGRVRFARVSYEAPITRPVTGWFGHLLLLPIDRVTLREPVELRTLEAEWIEGEPAAIRKK